MYPRPNRTTYYTAVAISEKMMKKSHPNQHSERFTETLEQSESKEPRQIRIAHWIDIQILETF